MLTELRESQTRNIISSSEHIKVIRVQFRIIKVSDSPIIRVDFCSRLSSAQIAPLGKIGVFGSMIA